MTFFVALTCSFRREGERHFRHSMFLWRLIRLLLTFSFSRVTPPLPPPQIPRIMKFVLSYKVFGSGSSIINVEWFCVQVSEVLSTMKEGPPEASSTPEGLVVSSDCLSFEVLYVGKLRMSGRKPPPTFIDEALLKFRSVEDSRRRDSLSTRRSSQVYRLSFGLFPLCLFISVFVFVIVIVSLRNLRVTEEALLKTSKRVQQQHRQSWCPRQNHQLHVSWRRTRYPTHCKTTISPSLPPRPPPDRGTPVGTPHSSSKACLFLWSPCGIALYQQDTTQDKRLRMYI